MKIFGKLLAAALLIQGASVASAAEVDDYVFWKTAELVDANCHYLKGVERRVLDQITGDALQAVPQSQQVDSGRTSNEDYGAWLAGIVGRAGAEASRVGCTSEAEPFLLRARGAASELIYQDLVLAFHFMGLPKEDPAHKALTADEIKAATSYDQFLQKLYGANFQAFAAAQRERASQRLPQQTSSFDGFYDPTLAVPEPGTDFAALWDLQTGVRKTVGEIAFEVFAEVAGYRLWPEPVGNNTLMALHPAGSTEPSAHVIAGPQSFDVVGGEEMPAVLVRMLSGELWVMTYGQAAATEAARQTAVALLVRTEPLAEGQSAGSAWSSKAWRTMTTRYDLVPVNSSCLGGGCWKVPQAGRDRLLEIKAFEDVELWLAADPAAAPEPESSPYSRGRVSHYGLHLLEGKPL